MIKVLVADDHPIIRQGLKQILHETPDIAVAAEAANGDEVLDKARSYQCDMVILDISMPGKNWLEIIQELKADNPACAILVLSRHSEEQYAIRALRAGASGYLTKSSVTEELINAIRKVATGKKYVSSSLSENIASMIQDQVDFSRLPHELLSENEFKVMVQLASGKKIIEIAAEMSLNQSTISTYRSRILQKLNLNTDADLVRYALQNQLID
jgi:two-component system invasion response regulator UvrY